MRVLPTVPGSLPPGGVSLATATVDRVDEDGTVHVAFAGGATSPARVAVPLGAAVPALPAGTAVVVLLEPGRDEPPVIVSAILAKVPVAPPQRVELAASQTLALRCGEASVELHADGRIELHGERIDAEAEGIHRIKGAQVRIN
ncbi:MAG: hypothetical protein U0168_29875 [Nannocystaceae bacterium]|jgi:hypothetical protein